MLPPSRSLRSRRWLAAAFVAAIGALLLQAPAASADDTVYFRHAHLSPDMPPVDVYVTSLTDPSISVTLDETHYGDISDYVPVPPGSYAVATRPAGAPTSSPPMLSSTVTVEAGHAYTVGCIGMHEHVHLTVLDDSLQLPAPGNARARVIQAASSAPTLDVSVVNGPQLGSAIPFADTTDYVDVPAGATTLRVNAPGGSPHDLPLSLQDGAVYTVLVLDATDGSFTPSLIADAAASAGTGPVPAESVAAGAGGTADESTPLWLVGLACLTAAGAAALVGRTVIVRRGQKVGAGTVD